MSKLVKVNLFPFKGARRATVYGRETGSVTVTSTGFELFGVGDREVYAVDDIEDGDGLMTITPRGRTKLKGSDHAHQQDRAMKAVDVDVSGMRQVTLTAAGVGSTVLDLERRYGPSTPSALHKGQVFGFGLGPEGDEFIRTVTGRPGARLMRVDRGAPRTVGPGQTRPSLAPDSQPFSLGVHESLAALNALKTGSDIPMLRYRPNVELDELDGGGPFAEHLARRVALGGVPFKVVAGIFRCVVTNLGEDGALVGGGLNLLRTRSGVRVDDLGTPDEGRPEPIFCVSLHSELGPEELANVSVGALAEVLEWRDSPNVAIR